MNAQFDQVSVIKKANVYFDGKCVSHTIVFPDGVKKTLGVLFPSLLTFSTNASEVMEIMSGKCRVRLKYENDWQTYGPGEHFFVPSNSSFEIETLEMLDYVCHFD